MRRHILLLPGLACLLSGFALPAVHAQTPFSSVNSVYAVVGARIEVGNGKVIEKGTVLVRDGMIEAVGVDVKVPPEAEVIKGDGLTVYPGFIDAHSIRGVTPPDAQPVQDVAPDISAGAPPFMREANRKGIRPELRAGDYLTLTDDLLTPARASGFTTELIMPTGGTMNGMGTLVNLTGMPRRDSIVRPDVAMNFTFTTSGSGYPGSLMGIQALTRQTLLDAQYFQMAQTAFAHGGSHRPPADASLAALQPVLSGAMPVLFDADSENEIRRAIRMSDEFGLKLMVSGGTEAYKALPVLSQRKIPVIVSLNFGQEPGVTAPAGQGGFGGPGGGAGGVGGRPGGGNRQGRGNRQPGGAPGVPGVPGTNPPANPPATIPPPADPPAAVPLPAAPAQTDANKPATNEKPGQDQGKPTPPKPDKEDAVTPNANPNQANKPVDPNAPPNSTVNTSSTDTEDTALPPPVLKERHLKWEEKVANAGMLSKAGVPIAFTTRGNRSQAEFLTNLRRAITAGLPRDAALRALTIDAARLMGVDRQMGTVEAGKVAALVVMSGDFVQPTTRVRYLFIDKNKFEPDRDLGPLPALPQRRRPADDDDNDGG